MLTGWHMLFKGLPYCGDDATSLFSLIEEEPAIELNPSSTLARQCLSCVLEFGGRPQDALPQLHTSLRLDPHSPMLSHVYNDLALCYFLLREHDAAVDAASKAVEINRGNVRGRQRLVAALAELGRGDEARAELEALLRKDYERYGKLVRQLNLRTE